MSSSDRGLAVVTGASSGIGYHLAKQCAQHDFDLLIAADDPSISDAAVELAATGATVESLEVDLATAEGIDRLYEAVGARPVAALLAGTGKHT